MAPVLAQQALVRRGVTEALAAVAVAAVVGIMPAEVDIKVVVVVDLPTLAQVQAALPIARVLWTKVVMCSCSKALITKRLQCPMG